MHSLRTGNGSDKSVTGDWWEGRKGSGTRWNVGRFEGWQVGEGVPPHYMDEYQNKGVAKWVPRKCMKRKGADEVGVPRG